MRFVNDFFQLKVYVNVHMLCIVCKVRILFYPFRLIPVSLSITASYVSALLVLGYPAEMYAFGGQWLLHAVGTALGAVLAAVLFVPVFYPLKLTSVNEVSCFYLFSFNVRMYGCREIIGYSVSIGTSDGLNVFVPNLRIFTSMDTLMEITVFHTLS